MSSSNTIFMIGYVWPEPGSSAAGIRDMHLVTTFLKAGWKVIYGSSAKENLYTLALCALGVETIQLQINHESFDHLIVQMKPDYVLFDRFVTEEHFGWRIQKHCPHAVRILDTQDLHYVRKLRHAAIIEGKSLADVLQIKFIHNEFLFRELASIYRCDLTLILSDFERILLVEEFHVDPQLLQLVRFYYPPYSLSPHFEERKDFVMIGNFRHPPNRDGVLWFHREIWLLIRQQLPDAQVFICGAYPPKDMMALDHPATGFRVLGPVKDQYAALKKYRVNLAPLRFGAGIKGKISDGWWSGTPVVTTSIGAEGMHDRLEWGGQIANDPQLFAHAAIRLYTQQTEWEYCQKAGYTLIDELYSEKTQAQKLISLLSQTRIHLDTLRQNNLFGSLLNFHTNRSTKYFSKWLELKASVSS